MTVEKSPQRLSEPVSNISCVMHLQDLGLGMSVSGRGTGIIVTASPSVRTRVSLGTGVRKILTGNNVYASGDWTWFLYKMP